MHSPQSRKRQLIAVARLLRLACWRFCTLVSDMILMIYGIIPGKVGNNGLTYVDSPNIRCFSIHPGAVDTELLHELESKMGLKLQWRWTDTILTGATILWLSTQRAEFLRGRWVSANWRVDELAGRKEQIIGENLLKLAFNARLGTRDLSVRYGDRKALFVLGHSADVCGLLTAIRWYRNANLAASSSDALGRR